MSDEKLKFKLKKQNDHASHNCVGHDHHHDHHHHNHEHHTLPSGINRAFIIGITLNLIFTAIEFFYGYLSNSLALVADAGHNLSDVLGLAIAFVAALLIKRKANKKFTFGLRGSTIISALLNSSLLFIAVGAIIWEAIHRLNSTVEIQTNTMMIVASIGIVINFVTAMFFHSHSHDDLNAKGAFLHLMSDAAVSLGVVITGLIIKKTGLHIIDPIVSLVISIIIIYGTWGLFKEALFLSINAVPEKINLEKIENYLNSLEGVSSIHDLHVWAMSTSENALTVHLIMPNGNLTDDFLRNVEQKLKTEFFIHHSTIQIEKNILDNHNHTTCYHS